jgi:tetratricopeptide (TPR) repeat protein
MFCVNCGNELPEGVNFCPNCGSRVVLANSDDIQDKKPEKSIAPAALALFETGIEYSKDGSQYKNAIIAFTKALDIEKNYFEALRERAKIYCKCHSYKNAIVDLDKLIEHDPDDAELFYLRGQAYFFGGGNSVGMNENKAGYKSKNKNQALLDFSVAIKLNPDYIEAYMARIGIYFSQKNLEGVIADSNELVRLEPSQYKHYASRATAYEDQGKHDDALADYSRAIDLEKKDAKLFISRCSVYFEKEEYDLALNDIDTAFKLGLDKKNIIIEEA